MPLTSLLEEVCYLWLHYIMVSWHFYLKLIWLVWSLCSCLFSHSWLGGLCSVQMAFFVLILFEPDSYTKLQNSVPTHFHTATPLLIFKLLLKTFLFHCFFLLCAGFWLYSPRGFGVHVETTTLSIIVAAVWSVWNFEVVFWQVIQSFYWHNK